jgi:hypothetical protein
VPLLLLPQLPPLLPPLLLLPLQQLPQLTLIPHCQY